MSTTETAIALWEVGLTRWTPFDEGFAIGCRLCEIWPLWREAGLTSLDLHHLRHALVQTVLDCCWQAARERCDAPEVLLDHVALERVWLQEIGTVARKLRTEVSIVRASADEFSRQKLDPFIEQTTTRLFEELSQTL
jgi:hypothetical protein